MLVSSYVNKNLLHFSGSVVIASNATEISCGGRGSAWAAEKVF